MEEAGNGKCVLDLFTKESHHRGIADLYLCQDLFPPGRFGKTISCNDHYVIAFKNPHDKRDYALYSFKRFPNVGGTFSDFLTNARNVPLGI